MNPIITTICATTACYAACQAAKNSNDIARKNRVRLLIEEEGKRNAKKRRNGRRY